MKALYLERISILRRCSALSPVTIVLYLLAANTTKPKRLHAYFNRTIFSSCECRPLCKRE